MLTTRLVAGALPRLLLGLGLCLGAAVTACAQEEQEEEEPPPVRVLYFAVENLELARVEQRGVTVANGASGIAFENLTVRPQTRYRLWVLDAATLRVARSEVSTPPAGETLRLPALSLRASSAHDGDRDRLNEVCEAIVGTDPRSPDTDRDSIPDGAELLAGTDPTDGLAIRTGLLASTVLPGTAQDVVATEQAIAVSLGSAGIAVLNVYNRLGPRVVALVDTPGDARRLAASATRVAVADGAGGLAIVDVADPPGAFVALTLSSFLLGGTAEAVTAAGRVAFVATSTGNVVSVDLQQGLVLERMPLGSRAVDLFVTGDTLYALTARELVMLGFQAGLELRGRIPTPQHLRPNHRLFVGNQVAYAVHGQGVDTFDVSDPAAPTLIAATETAQFGWKQLALNGSGLALAAVSPNSTLDGPHDVSLYEASDPARTDEFVVTFTTPGLARAVTIHGGLGYVADHEQGLQVVNYLAQDTRGVPPTIALMTAFGAVIEENKLAHVSAETTDDVQVRSVEFYVDGQRVAEDASFPFEHYFAAPALAGGRTSFVLQARAFDTGGNQAWSEPLEVQLLPDATPPHVLRLAPNDGAVIGRVGALAAFTDEPLDLARGSC